MDVSIPSSLEGLVAPLRLSVAETDWQREASKGVELLVCSVCRHRAQRERLLVTSADGQQTQKTIVRCLRRARTHHWLTERNKRAACPIITEESVDMGVFSDAIDGLSLKKLAPRVDPPVSWQHLYRMRDNDKAGYLKDDDPRVEAVIKAATEMREELAAAAEIAYPAEVEVVEQSSVNDVTCYEHFDDVPVKRTKARQSKEKLTLDAVQPKASRDLWDWSRELELATNQVYRLGGTDLGEKICQLVQTRARARSESR